MIQKTIKVRLTLQEEMLGMMPQGDIHEKYIASKAPDASTIEDEIEAVGLAEVVRQGITVFPRLEDGTPFYYNYQIKGMFKGACSNLAKATGKDPETGKKAKAVNESSKLTAFKKNISGLLFVQPRKIPIILPNKPKQLSTCSRPLRASTPQGERISIASSEVIPAGSYIEFEIELFSIDMYPAVKEWLDYGKWYGLGQWRNSGKGIFTWEELTA